MANKQALCTPVAFIDVLAQGGPVVCSSAFANSGHTQAVTALTVACAPVLLHCGTTALRPYSDSYCEAPGCSVGV